MKKLSEPAIVTEVEARVRTLTPQSVRRWGRMTPHQAICHLSDSYLVGLGERPATAKAAPLAGLQRITALYLLPRWPHGVATMPEADQERGGTKPVEFAADQNALMELLRRFSVQCVGMLFGIDEMRPHVILDDLGHQTGHRSSRAGDQMHHLFAARLAVERALNRLDLAPDAAHARQ